MASPEAALGPGPAAAVDTDRFVAFTFAGANLVVECDPDGIIGYAAGAFRTEFRQPAEAFLGQHLRSLTAVADHEALDDGLWLLKERGRLLPMTIRMAGPGQNRLALAGLVLPGAVGPQRLCLTFAPLPQPALALASMRSLARASETRLRMGAGGSLGLIEISGAAGTPSFGEAVGKALLSVAPDAVAGEIAPGRYGVLAETGPEMLEIAVLLEKALKMQGTEARVGLTPVDLDRQGLTGLQAARALRHALSVFARSGGDGLGEAGFAHGLAGYLQKASVHVNALRRVIRAGRFGMSYQPIVSLSDGVVHHHEALIRPLPVPECQVATPQEFVLLVETLGLAEELDLAVALKTCDAVAKAGLATAFNISGQSVQSPRFRSQLTTLLKGHDAHRAGLISVELTETADIEVLDEAVATAEALRGMGVTFCLDDFGSGAADVRLLHRLGADIVKLDGSYVAGMAAGGRDRAFVAGMVDIAHAAGAAVVAERVETAAEAEALRGLGVQYGQGWLFGRPGPLPEPVQAPAATRRRGAQESWG